MTGTLTQAEANRLIKMLKKTVEEHIIFPSKKEAFLLPSQEIAKMISL